jgi:hypothetical protein
MDRRRKNPIFKINTPSASDIRHQVAEECDSIAWMVELSLSR